MRLLAITNRFPRPGHPTDSPFNFLQLRALAKLHEVRVIAPIAWPDRLHDQTPAPAESESEGMRIYYPTFWFTPKVLQSHHGTFFLQSIRRTLDGILKDFQPDAVFAIWAHPDGWAATKIARQLGVPALVKVIGSDVLVLSRKEGRRRRIVEALRSADTVFAVSHDLAHHVSLLGADPEKLHVIPEGTDTEMFCPGEQSSAQIRLNLAPSGRVLMFVGNLLFSKGAGLVIQACAALRDQGVDFTCYLVGTGKDAGRLRSLAAKLKLNGRVNFVGRSPQDRLADWYRAADLLMLPSYSEGSPNVLREAICCGKPYVATRVGGIPEISLPAFSRLVDTGDVSQLVNAIREMLTREASFDPEFVRSRIVNWDESAARIDRLLHALVAKNKSRVARTDNKVSVSASQEARQKLGISQAGQMIVWVGQMEPATGLDTLIEAAAILKRSGREFQVYLVGDGPLRERLVADSIVRGLTGILHFVGQQHSRNLPDWYRAADLTVVLSCSKQRTNDLREPLAFGTPLIASRINGMPNIASNATKWLVDSGDAEELACAIGRAMPSPIQILSVNDSHGTTDSNQPVVAPTAMRLRSQRSGWRQQIRKIMTATLPTRMLLTGGPTSSNSVCLTFDDGPHPEYTPRLLKVLREQGVVATFFVVGMYAVRFPDLVRQIAAEGHAIGSHSFYHTWPLNTTSRQLTDEALRTRDLLHKLLGRDIPIFRPPQGNVTAPSLLRLWRAGLQIALWNSDPNDFACRSTEELADRFRAAPIRAGDLVLLHDRLPHAAAALPDVIARTREGGLSFTTVPQWMQ